MIVLDTQAAVWMAAEPQRLTPAAAGALETEWEVAISTVTAYEIAYLSMRGRIELNRPASEWINDLLVEHEIEAIAPDISIASRAGQLSRERFHGDPADRLIYATALERGARLISADRRLHELDPARVVW